MTFTNAEISLEGVPRAGDLTFHPIESSFMKVKFIQWLILWLILFTIAVLLFIFVEKLQQIGVIATVSVILLFLAGFQIFVMRKSVEYKAYAIREHDVVYRTGWLVKSIKVVPFNRIQHCSVDEGAVARRYGLASIRLFTSGGNEADLRIPGLKAAFAADLRELIISKTRQHGSNI
ncbi:MAG: hypothetical protein EOO01_30920 [Chitinophagaceae bacterium]|nr:MAG: hypothetical protein EOO01_30920 [Chitinophagaceae bacterium]